LLTASWIASLVMAGCAAPERMPAKPSVPPARWHAPLPHEGQTAELQRWWEQFDDPLVPRLVAAAQEASPTLAAAQSRLAQANAARVAAGSNLLPKVGAVGSLVRGRQDFVSPMGNLASLGLQSAWEIDVFGGARAGRDAAQARLEGAEAGWHEARVSVAAEVASTYVGLRACQAQLAISETDATSRAETARLTEQAARAGFQSPANEALSRASAAQARAQFDAQRTQCESTVKALVALTGLEEPALRDALAARSATMPQPAQIIVPAVPGDVLNQRPDLHAAARELVAASAEVGQTRAQLLPSVSLSGSISAARFEAGGTSGSGTLWSLGPLQVTVPLFDSGARHANVDAARARYEAAAATYRAQLRAAVREVEDALLQLDGTARRTEDARISVEGYEASYRAADARYRGGLSSLFELEDARRTAAAAQRELIELQRERVAAWIALYRAMGGGWTPGTSAPTAPAQAAVPPQIVTATP
jgi:NodT family efflux transporter outer membrane factor (OMF) lipoprotein